MALNVTASPRISIPLTSGGLPPPTENGLILPRGTCRVEGLNENGSLPVRLCPLGVKREGRGE